MASKKQCRLCGRVSRRSVVAKESNTGSSQAGSRRCECRKGCRKAKANA